MFDNGISDYVHVEATVTMAFPVDRNGVPHVNCRNCFYYRTSANSCDLNGEKIFMPEKYVGASCPFNQRLEETE